MSDWKNREHVRTLDGVVHMLLYQTVTDDWLAMCGRQVDQAWEPELAVRVADPIDCLGCIANEDRWDEETLTLRPGREFG